jgi:hypothetical protein
MNDNNNQEETAENQETETMFRTFPESNAWSMGWDGSALQEPSNSEPSNGEKTGSNFPKARAWAVGWDSSVLE